MSYSWARRRFKFQASCQRGVSLIELMISLGLGAFMLLGIIALVSSVSKTRFELAETSDQIENGRYASFLFQEEIALAGFYGQYHPGPNVATYTLPDPCMDENTAIADFGFSNATPSMPAPVQGYAAGATLPGCIAGTNAGEGHAVSGSEALVIRRVATGSVAAASAVSDVPYLQISNCETDSSPFVFSKTPDDFTLLDNDCLNPPESGATVVPVWPFISRTYFLSSCEDCSGDGDGIPTLKVREYVNNAASIRPLVSGVEDMHFSYGLDLDGDGAPDCYSDNPAASTATTGCASADWSATPAENWEDVVAVNIALLVRGGAATDKADTRSYDLGRAQRITPPDDGYQRRVFSTVVMVPNVAGARE